ncbi:MAG: hypothetical protein JOZ38_03560 [Candidatus Eremiobacteraeota bacterium]|nr:hypothetical protein [Candidatus Eremiobacteraeota bacterium]
MRQSSIRTELALLVAFLLLFVLLRTLLGPLLFPSRHASMIALIWTALVAALGFAVVRFLVTRREKP